MKHLKHLFTALLLLYSLTASAHDFEVGGIYYNILSETDKTVEVTRGRYTGSVVIPENVVYNGTTYSVTSIGKQAFTNYSGLTSITIPNSVTSIGEEAFSGCSRLTSVVIGNSVTSIGEGAFYYCTGLTSLEIPNSVTSIGNEAFNYCQGLTSVVIGNSVTSIGDKAFFYCQGLTSITIPNCVTSIGDYAFQDCTGLTSITIPNSVTSIGKQAFYGCYGLTSVEIGNSVKSIGNYAFGWCGKIKEIKVGAEKPIRGDENIFTDTVYDNATLYIPNGTKSLYEKREPWNIFFYIVEMDFTGIDEVFDEMKGESGKVKTVYDLSGRVVENPANGIYILNGKKVIVK